MSNVLSIDVCRGAGTGPTELAAFDAALRAVGVGDANLIRLSSVIPPGSDVGERSTVTTSFGWGDRLYCVYADAYESRPGHVAAAGVGWVRKTDGSGAGLFVEHHGTSEDEVCRSIDATLHDMIGARPDAFGPVSMVLQSVACVDRPVCAVVLASYLSQPWDHTEVRCDH